ncbi:MAG: hypothetical protein FJ215_02575 [Ignavibacteria bacterium]|nr:hypothetical protein [Ignavibacteria bacterium]
MVRNLALFFSTFTSFIGILIAFHSLVLDDGPWIWNLSKAAASVFVVCVGLLTWKYCRTDTPHPFTERALLFSVMTLMVVGGAGLAWTLHRSLVSDDIEAWLVIVIMIVIVQGCVTTIHLLECARTHGNRLNHRSP